MKFLFLSLLIVLSPNANASFDDSDSLESSMTKIVTADQMSCIEAVNTYEKYGRIYVVANGKDVVPLYGMTPIRKSNSLQCYGRSKMKVTYFVRTNDKRHCAIAVYCQPK